MTEISITPKMTCPICKTSVTETDNFCPNCGAKLKDAPLSLSVGRKTYIYIFSFFLAPLGLGYAYKYIRLKDPEAKKVGYIVIALTVVAVIIMIWSTSAFTSWEMETINAF